MYMNYGKLPKYLLKYAVISLMGSSFLAITGKNYKSNK